MGEWLTCMTADIDQMRYTRLKWITAPANKLDKQKTMVTNRALVSAHIWWTWWMQICRYAFYCYIFVHVLSTTWSIHYILLLLSDLLLLMVVGLFLLGTSHFSPCRHTSPCSHACTCNHTSTFNHAGPCSHSCTCSHASTCNHASPC